MFFRPKKAQPQGDAAWLARERSRRFRELMIQLLVAVLFFGFLWILSRNVAENLASRNILHGFAFLMNAAGFEIGESMIPFQSSDTLLRAFGIGILNTLKVSVLAIFSSLLLGIVIAFMKLSRQPVLHALGWAHVEFYRNIPLIIGLLAIYLTITEMLPDMETVMNSSAPVMLDKAGLQFPVPLHNGMALLAAAAVGLIAGEAARRVTLRKSTFLVAWGIAFGVFCVTAIAVWLLSGAVFGWAHPHLEGFVVEGGGALSPEFLALWLGLTLFSSAPIAEVIRAGILSVGEGQWLAGEALGLSPVQTASYVVFPQAMKLSVPPLASQFMNLTKNSSLAVVVGYPDVVCIGNTSINTTGQALEMICLIMLVYLVLNLVTSVIMNLINARFSRGEEEK